MLAWRPRLRASHEIRRQAGGRLKTKAPHTGRFCLWQNRSLFESNVQAACKHTTCCTRQQAQTVNDLRLTPNSLKRRTLLPSAAQTPLPRMNRGGSAYHKPTFRSRPHAADGQTSAPNSPSVSACVAVRAYNRHRAARSHFEPVCTPSRGIYRATNSKAINGI